MACQVTKPANATCTGRVWKALHLSRNTGKLTAQLQILWHDFPQEVKIYLIDSMLRCASACIAVRDGFTTN
ncbi:hypothetical protein TNCV_121341 [Trichonephila clavipes]|nr:hypothetical protein TNCV_121341 [Trichonephila clavipes]